MSRFLLLAVSLGVLLEFAPAQAPAAQSNAFFAGPGTHGALLHNQSLLPGTSILAGETVSTGPGGAAVLTTTHGPGGVIELGPNTTATVAPGTAAGVDQIQVQQGGALITGGVEVSTPQQQTFAPGGESSRYVINASAASSSVGVLTGSVNTMGPGTAATVIPAGDAVQVTGSGGVTELSRVPLNRVRPPESSAAVPQQTPASQSQ